MSDNIKLGKLGETRALEYLLKNGYQLLEKNFRTKSGEIDIVVKSDKTIIFIEVKSSIINSRIKPYEEVTGVKMQHLKKAISYYLLKKNIRNYKLSIGVISIQFNIDLSINKLDFYKNVDL